MANLADCIKINNNNNSNLMKSRWIGKHIDDIF